MPTVARTSPSNCANTSSPISPTGRITTPSSRLSPGCSRTCARRTRRNDHAGHSWGCLNFNVSAVKRSARDDKELRIYRLLRSSPAAWKIIESRAAIEHHLRSRPRRVWPCATIAKLFGISPGLLRKWIDQGLLSRFRRPSEHHRPGLTARSVQSFLRELAEKRPMGHPSGEEAVPARGGKVPESAAGIGRR